jgi:RNA polymerase sigma-70 factor (ECF subfamily)
MESHERVMEFDRVVTPHLARAYNLARLLVGNIADAEDLVQEASLRAFRGLDSFHGGDAKTWLLVIVRNVCYSFLGSKPRTGNVVEFEEEQHSTGAVTPESNVLQNASAADVRRAIEELPAEFREALVLREMEELSYKQIADITGVAIGTVMSRLSRAREQLRQRLQKQAGRGA